MTTLHRSPDPSAAGYKAFRVIAVSFAVLLAAQSMWLLLSELARSSISQFPLDKASAAYATNERAAARWAALFGVIRGDLWAASAFAHADLLWAGKDTAQSSTMQAIAETQASLNRALADSPHQSGAWLFLADLASRYPSIGLDPSEPLKMSYYTGPSDRRLMPLRLRISVQSTAFNDVEMRQLVGRDLRLLLTGKQTTQVANVYGVASSAAKDFIEQTIKDVDPTALDRVRDASRKQNMPK